MPVVVWYRRSPEPKFTKYGESLSIGIGQTYNAAKFCYTPTRSVWDIHCRKYVLPENWTKVHQNRRRPAMNKCLPSSHSANDVWKIYFISVTEFFTPGASPGPTFTNLGRDVQHGPLYQSAKFCPILTTPLRDICCQISWILLTTWLTKNSKRYVSA